MNELNYVQNIIHKHQNFTIGILAKTDEYLKDYKAKIKTNNNIFIMTINEAQGVEFDTVFLVGINNNLYENISNSLLKKERERVNRDLLYVALTRAVNNLYVLGNTTIKKI